MFSGAITVKWALLVGLRDRKKRGNSDALKDYICAGIIASTIIFVPCYIYSSFRAEKGKI